MQKSLYRKHVLQLMRLTCTQLLLLALTAAVGVARPAPAQGVLDRTVTLSLRDVPLKTALSRLESTARVRFAYSRSVLELGQTVSVAAQGEPLAAVLDRLLPPLHIRYEVAGGQILLSRTAAVSPKNRGEGVAPAEATPEAPADVTVSGRVTDEAGAGIPAVNVSVKNTTRGTTTGTDGRYALAVPDGQAVLVFSSVGYEKQEVAVGNRTTVDVTLKTDVRSLSEVVVVGYGTQERAKLTTSVASVGAKQIQNLPVSNAAQALAGQVAGVFVQQGSGQPGAAPVLRIRGFGSINAGSEPLYVIDGYVTPDASLFNSLNPNIIESIEVLKDAAAGAIYGSRAGNGVIIVTTKRGKAGKTQFAFSANAGTSSLIKKIEVMNRDQYLDIATEALRNSNLPVPPVLTTNTGQLPDTDWQDAIFDPAPFSNYQVSATGGSEKVRFFLSGNYLKQGGIVRRTGYENYQFNANLDAQLSRKLKAGFSFVPSYTRTQVQPTVGSVTGGGGYGGVGGLIQSALAMVPIIPVYTPDGDYGQVMKLGYQGFAVNRIYNPVATSDGIDDVTKQVRLVGRSFLDYQIFDGLSANVSFGGLVSSAFNSVFVAPFVAGEGSLLNTANRSTPTYARSNASQSNTMVTNWLFEGLLTYQKTFGEAHNLKVDAGYSSQRNNVFQTGAFSSINDRGTANATSPQPAFSSDLVPNINGAALILGFGSTSQYTFLSTFGRVNYDYKGRYLVQASLRRDGSSKFAPNHRFGTFPAVSVGWRVVEEPFLKNQKLFSDLKLRLSYGVSGNDQIANYGWLGRQVTNANYTFGNGSQQGIQKITFENRDFRWETNTQTNLGLDLGVLRDRVTLTADYYVRTTRDLILARPLPTENGVAGSVLANVGSMENRGVELALNTRNTTGAVKWTTGVFFTLNRNKVLTLVGGRSLQFGVAGYEGTGAFATAFRFEEGQPIGNVYGYNVVGIFKDQAEFDAYPRFGNSTVGNAKFEDVNRDGRIDGNDITLLGNVLPKFTYGITNNVSYRGFDLSVILDGVQGAKLFNPILRQVVLGRAFENSLAELTERYRSPADPGAGQWGIAKQNLTGGVNQPTSQYLFDASYLRVRNVTLGYTLPGTLLNRLWLQNARVFVSAQNYLTFTKYFGYSPEANNYQGAAGGAQIGVDMGAYPLAKTLTFGVNVGF